MARVVAPAPEGPTEDPLAQAIRCEASAWVNRVMMTLEYCRAAATLSDGLLETLRPLRPDIDEAAATGKVLRDLAAPQLMALACETTALDHPEIRRRARDLALSQTLGISLTSMLTAALLRGHAKGS